MKKIHLRDAQIRATAIHFLGTVPDDNLTDDLSKVTCRMCLKMLERAKRYAEKK